MFAIHVGCPNWSYKYCIFSMLVGLVNLTWEGLVHMPLNRPLTLSTLENQDVQLEERSITNACVNLKWRWIIWLFSTYTIYKWYTFVSLLLIKRFELTVLSYTTLVRHCFYLQMYKSMFISLNAAPVYNLLVQKWFKR